MKLVSKRQGSSIESDLELGDETSLLDIVDHVLTKGVVVTGDLVLGVADIDLVYLRLSAVLCAADRILPGARSRRSRARGGRSIAARLKKPSSRA